MRGTSRIVEASSTADVMNAITPPATSPRVSSGSVMRTNVRAGGAPRLWADSSIETCSCCMVA